MIVSQDVIQLSIYKDSVSHAALNVLDQLQLLRCSNNAIKECVGFTFLKFPTDDSQNKNCVTKVTVSFTNDMFGRYLGSIM